MRAVTLSIFYGTVNMTKCAALSSNCGLARPARGCISANCTTTWTSVICGGLATIGRMMRERLLTSKRTHAVLIASIASKRSASSVVGLLVAARLVAVAHGLPQCRLPFRIRTRISRQRIPRTVTPRLLYRRFLVPRTTSVASLGRVVVSENHLEKLFVLSARPPPSVRRLCHLGDRVHVPRARKKTGSGARGGEHSGPWMDIRHVLVSSHSFLLPVVC